MRREIAKVKSSFLGREDHGIFTAYVDVDYGGSGQMVGGYGLDAYDSAAKRRFGTAYGLEWIVRFMRACGVDQWEKLPGRTIYVLFDVGDHPAGVAPLPTEPGKPFIFADLRKEFDDDANGRTAAAS